MSFLLFFIFLQKLSWQCFYTFLSHRNHSSSSHSHCIALNAGSPLKTMQSPIAFLRAQWTSSIVTSSLESNHLSFLSPLIRPPVHTLEGFWMKRVVLLRNSLTAGISSGEDRSPPSCWHLLRAFAHDSPGLKWSQKQLPAANLKGSEQTVEPSESFVVEVGKYCAKNSSIAWVALFTLVSVLLTHSHWFLRSLSSHATVSSNLLWSSRWGQDVSCSASTLEMSFTPDVKDTMDSVSKASEELQSINNDVKRHSSAWRLNRVVAAIALWHWMMPPKPFDLLV